MTDVIAELRRDMRQRLGQIERELEGLEDLVRERDQLKAALAKAPFAEVEEVKAKPAAAPRRRAKASASRSRPRAKRGANLEAVLQAVDQRPGVTATTVADVTKISKADTYNTLAKLVEQGKLEKTELPGGQTGYKTAV
jgi:sugar-specific transcriptional regulator TrmB